MKSRPRQSNIHCRRSLSAEFCRRLSQGFGLLPVLSLLGLFCVTHPAGARSADSVLRLTARKPAEAPAQWQVTFQDRGARPSYMDRMGVGGVDGVVRVDCASRRFQLEELVLYAEALDRPPLGRIGPRPGWRAAGDDTLLGRVVEAACAPGVKVVPAGAAGVKVAAARPPSVPAPVAVAAALPSQVAPSATAMTPAAGPVRAQLGAFSTPGQALEVWARLQAEGGFNLAGLAPRVESATVGGKVFHRLLVEGFPSRQAARELCAALSARERACFVRG